MRISSAKIMFLNLPVRGVEAVHEFVSHGYLEADSNVIEHLKVPAATACDAQRKLPHIILLHDESSFILSLHREWLKALVISRHFQSFDGKSRKLVVEGAGGPSWFTEYNVLTGLSARSYGRFATSVTRIAGGRVARGLPHSLTRCGQARVSAFIRSTALFLVRGPSDDDRHRAPLLDMQDLRHAQGLKLTVFTSTGATKIIAREGGSRPLFLYVYNVANHFPWDTALRPELTPMPGHDLGTRSRMSMNTFAVAGNDRGRLPPRCLDRLAREFPAEVVAWSYLWRSPARIHARHVIDPLLGGEELARHLEASDPRYFPTYLL